MKLNNQTRLMVDERSSKRVIMRLGERIKKL